MKQILLVVALVGCASTPKVVPNSPEAEAAIENAIRERLSGMYLDGTAENPTGELTMADYKKVTVLELRIKVVESHRHRKVSIGADGLPTAASLKRLPEAKKAYEERIKALRATALRQALTNVKGLEKLTQVYNLELSNNPLTEVKSLKKLTRLVSLDLLNTKLTKAQIDALKKALPECVIYTNARK